jgi:modified peptide precursor CbpA
MDVGASVGIFFCFFATQKGNPMKNATKTESPKKASPKTDVIAYRKTCQAKGTGLSHYILMDKKAK